MRGFALALLLLSVVSATVGSCGGGSGGDSNGNLCEQCGDSDGPCNAAGADIPAGASQPGFCPNRDDGSCHVSLICTRQVDSAQRRCYPANPDTNALDLRYECGGSRPQGTPVPVATPTLTGTPTQTSTAATATATGPTPSATPTPDDGTEDVSVTITIEQPSGNDVPPIFTVTVTYPSEKGSFLLDGVVDCDDTDFDLEDNGTGRLLMSFIGDAEGTDAIDVDCTFHQTAGLPLTAGELNGEAGTLRVSFEIF